MKMDGISNENAGDKKIHGPVNGKAVYKLNGNASDDKIDWLSPIEANDYEPY